MTQEKITIQAIQARKGGSKLTMVTAYDTPIAAIVDQAGADMILVGDTLADNVLGFSDTLAATVEMMVHHAAAVSRAQPRALVIIEKATREAGELDPKVQDFIKTKLSLKTTVPGLMIQDDGSLLSGSLENGKDIFLTANEDAKAGPDIMIGPDDTPTLSFTSGSEGRPKVSHVQGLARRTR